MVKLNKEFIDGVDELDNKGNLNSFLKEVLNYELEIYNSKNKTPFEIKDNYKILIDSFSQEDKK